MNHGATSAALRKLALRWSDPEVWREVGEALYGDGRLEDAYAAFAEASRLAPDDLALARSLADAAIRAGRAERELARWRIAAEAGGLAGLMCRAHLLGHLGRREEAIEAAERLAALAPESAPAASERAALYSGRADDDAAESALRRALALDPDDVSSRHALGRLWLRRGRPAAAQRELAICAANEGSAAFADLALSELQTGRQREARTAVEAAIALAPSDPVAHRLRCNILAYCEGVTGAELTAAMKKCGALWPRGPDTPFESSREPDRRLRVGLLGGAFRRHPVSWLTIRGLEGLDREAFEIHCFPQSAGDDDFARRWRALAASWHEIGELDDAAVARRIRSARIDILIDLGGYLNNGRLPVLARRPAPVQIKWVGAQYHTTGIAEVDYLIGDGFETPPELAHLYGERLLSLPHSYVCYDPPAADVEVAALPFDRNGFVTFGSFNNLMKITPGVLDVWARIILRVEGSRLHLRAPQLDESPTALRLLGAFEERGVDPGRIDAVGGSSEHRQWLDAYNKIDLALQPFPYCGGVTLLEGLWMGTPSLAMRGESFAARHGISHLSNVGLADWLADTPDQYLERAVAMSADLNGLRDLRAGLRDRLTRGPLCDGSRFGRDLGAPLRRAWATFCETS